jgi:hypothetical protein
MRTACWLGTVTMNRRSRLVVPALKKLLVQAIDPQG